MDYDSLLRLTIAGQITFISIAGYTLRQTMAHIDLLLSSGKEIADILSVEPRDTHPDLSIHLVQARRGNKSSVPGEYPQEWGRYCTRIDAGMDEQASFGELVKELRPKIVLNCEPEEAYLP